ncbi:MAG: diacylglycerol kinase family protein [Nocardioides sp.]
MDPLLVIANAAAGSTDADRLERGLAVLRARASVEVAETGNPGELDGVLHRAGSRRIVVAGGDGSLHAVVAALHRRNDLHGAVLALPRSGRATTSRAVSACRWTSRRPHTSP